MTREEIEKQMDALIDKYVQTRKQDIIEELYESTIELDKIDKESGS